MTLPTPPKLRCFAAPAAIAVCLAISATASAQTKKPARTATKTQIVFLGTGNPRPTPDRMGPSVAIIVNGTPYLVDAGVGVVRRAAEASRKGVTALEPTNLRYVFITHLHSDHTIGLPDLMTTPWIIGRKVPLELYGPPGISAMAKHLREAYKEDANVRIKGPEHANDAGNEVNSYDIKPGFVYQDANVKVIPFAVKHGAWKNSYGYRFETPDRTIVIAGDAAPSESVAEACNGCDVLVHEAYTQLGYKKSDAAWQQYLTQAFTSTTELGALASKARPKMLILYHQMFLGGPTDTEAGMLKEIRAAYKGKVVSARDLDIY